MCHLLHTPRGIKTSMQGFSKKNTDLLHGKERPSKRQPLLIPQVLTEKPAAVPRTGR